MAFPVSTLDMARLSSWMICEARLPLATIISLYFGDGSSDVHVMLHVNRLDGLTIAVSENRYLTQIAKRAILSEDALGVLVPIMEDILGWDVWLL